MMLCVAPIVFLLAVAITGPPSPSHAPGDVAPVVSMTAEAVK